MIQFQGKTLDIICSVFCIVYHKSYIICNISYKIFPISYIIDHRSYMICHMSYITHHISFIINNMSLIMYRVSNIVYHMKYIIHDISYKINLNILILLMSVTFFLCQFLELFAQLKKVSLKHNLNNTFVNPLCPMFVMDWRNLKQRTKKFLLITED